MAPSRRDLIRMAVAAPLSMAAGAPLAAFETPATRSRLALATPMTAITAADARLIAVGERGVALLSDDDGVSWTQADSVPVDVTLTSVRFRSATDGFATGHSGVVLRTRDAGQTWTKVLDGRAAASLAADAARALGGAAAREADRLLRDGPDKPFLDIVLDSQGGVLTVGAYGMAARSTDDGRTWSDASGLFQDPDGLHVYRIAGNDQVRYAVGEQGLLLVSRDGGDYAAGGAPAGGTLFGVCVMPGGTVLAYGLRGRLIRSSDEGRSWSATTSGADSSIVAAVVSPDGTVLLAASSGQILCGSDNGQAFRDAAVRAPFAPSGLAQAGGAIVVAGAGGVARLPATPDRDL